MPSCFISQTKLCFLVIASYLHAIQRYNVLIALYQSMDRSDDAVALAKRYCRRHFTLAVSHHALLTLK